MSHTLSTMPQHRHPPPAPTTRTHTYCSHPVMLAHHHPHYTLWHSFHSSSYIFIYSTSLEAVIYDFNTSTQTIRHPGVEGDSQQQQVDKVLGVAVCLQASQPHSPCPPVSGGGDDVTVVVLVGGRRFLEIFIIQFPMSVGNGRIHLLAAASEKGTTGRRRRDKR